MKEKQNIALLSLVMGTMRFAVKEGDSVLGYINENGCFIPHDEKIFSADVLMFIAKKCDLVRIAMESLSGPPTR